MEQAPSSENKLLVVHVRLFAGARQAAGTGSDVLEFVEPLTVAAALGLLRERYGADFGRVLDHSKVWVDGEPAEAELGLRPGNELAVLPPVSGG